MTSSFTGKQLPNAAGFLMQNLCRAENVVGRSWYLHIKNGDWNRVIPFHSLISKTRTFLKIFGQLSILNLPAEAKQARGKAGYAITSVSNFPDCHFRDLKETDKLSVRKRLMKNVEFVLTGDSYNVQHLTNRKNFTNRCPTTVDI